MKLEGAAVLVSGGNRGLGRALVEALVRRGAGTVYVGVRDRRTLAEKGRVALALDVTDEASVRGAAAQCSDVNLLINNAGICRFSPHTGPDAAEDAREEMEVNYFGLQRMCRAFAPVLAANGGGAVVNVLSTLSLHALPRCATYCASKSAAWSLTNSLRMEMRAQGSLVCSVYAGLIDTDMVREAPGAKMSPSAAAAAILDGIERSDEEIFVDDHSRRVKAGLADDLKRIYPAVEARSRA